jgi:hypothetical protein
LFRIQALATAETSNQVVFTIRLWSHKKQVLVELQRVSGCCFFYQQTVKALFRAAKGEPERRLSYNYSIPDCVPQESPEETKQCVQEGIDCASALLKKEGRFDSHALAMESLVHITNATKCRTFAAHCILCGDFLSTLICLVEASRMERPGTAMQGLSSMEEEHFRVMHRHALAVLANCLSALDDSGELAHVLKQQPELSSTTFLLALLDDVANATDRPHDACQATRCLRALVQTCSDTKSRIVGELGGLPALEAAHSQGICRNAYLETECQKLKLHL